MRNIDTIVVLCVLLV